MSTIPTYMTRKGVLTPGHGIVKTGTAGVEIPMGAVVARYADGTIGPMVQGATSFSYLGVAVNDMRKQVPYDGFYAAGKKVPYIATGVATAWLLGGQHVHSGDFVTNCASLGAGTEALGVLKAESAATRTVYSLGRVLDADDIEADAYDETVYASAAGGVSGDVVTFGVAGDKTNLELVDGDMVVIDSDTYAEVNMVADADRSSTTVQMVKNCLNHHATSIMMYKLVPITIELL